MVGGISNIYGAVITSKAFVPTGRRVLYGMVVGGVA